MTRNLEDYDQINIRLLPFDDHSWLYLQHGPSSGLPRGIGRKRSYRLDLHQDELDLDRPEEMLMKIADAIARIHF